MTQPKRQLGVLVAAAIVVANMIGAGVFTSAGFTAAFQFEDPMVDDVDMGRRRRDRAVRRGVLRRAGLAACRTPAASTCTCARRITRRSGS